MKRRRFLCLATLFAVASVAGYSAVSLADGLRVDDRLDKRL